MTGTTASISHLDLHDRFRIGAIEVRRTEYVTPNMIRVIFGGDHAKAMYSPSPTDDIRIQLPIDFTEVPQAPEVIWQPFQLIYPDGAPPSDLRAYTVRKLDTELGELWIDFAIHGEGIASNWAEQAQPGQVINCTSPHHSHVLEGEFDQLWLVGDETALPAIGRHVEEAKAGSRITVVAEVTGIAEEQHWRSVADVKVHWVHRVDGKPGLLEQRVRALPVPEGPTYVFAAGEAGQIRGIRRYLVNELGLPKDLLDCVGYWKRPNESDAEIGYFIEDDEAGVEAS